MKFSVIVPIYKVEKYLKKCIESVLSQSFRDFELILVDDGSPDNCPQICDEYEKQDIRIKVIHKTNGGLVSARKAGLLAAKGEYICYVDGDDWVKENWLEVVNRKAIVPYCADMVIFGIEEIFVDHSEELLDPLPEGIYNKNALNADIYPNMIYDAREPFCKGIVFPAACNKIYKKELLLKHFCTDDRIKMGEDNAFVFECLVYSESVYFCRDLLYCYNRSNDTSMTNSYDPNRFRNNAWLTTYIEEHLGGKNEVIDGQINAFKAYWLIMAIFHEVKCGRKLVVSSKYIKEAIKEYGSMKGISLQGLPRSAKIYLMMLRMHLYNLTLIASKIQLSLRP